MIISVRMYFIEIPALLLLCLSLLAFGDTTVPFFRKDYEYNSMTRNFYKVHTIGRSFTQAQNRCKQEGATLFVPDSKEDHDAATKMIQDKLKLGYKWAWIGLHDLLSEGEFITVDGRHIEDIYNEWDTWEPSNSGGHEHCVALKDNGKSNDEECHKPFPFLCKKPASGVKWNLLCDLPDQSYIYNRELGKCYKLHLLPRNWTDAYGVCSAEQSYLAVINSRAEADYLAKIIRDADKTGVRAPGYLPGIVHAGFHNQLDEGFVTVQGVKIEDTGYNVWGRGQPDNAGGTEKCGSYFADGALNDITCAVVCVFVCEHDIGALVSSIDDRLQSNQP